MKKVQKYTVMYVTKCVLSAFILYDYIAHDFRDHQAQHEYLFIIPMLIILILDIVSIIDRHKQEMSETEKTAYHSSVTAYIIFIVLKFLLADTLYSFSAHIFHGVIFMVVVIVNVIAAIITFSVIRMFLKMKIDRDLKVYYELTVPHIFIPYEYYVYFIYLLISAVR